MVFLAETGTLTSSFTGGSGFNLWQSLGGLTLVFGLLVVSLKFLGKWNRRHGGGESQLLTVWHLGPKREIQVLRLGQEVHYIYRHEGAMVLLKQESIQEWERQKSREIPPATPQGLAQQLKNRLPRLSLRPDHPVSSPKATVPFRVGDLLP